MKKVIIITGPTAAGKTAIAIELAKQLNTEIISADSRQCYKELCIGVARPSVEELAEVPHHFIASHSIHEEVNAATFEEFALATAYELFKKHDTIVMVGGTGLYIRAFCEGLDKIPAIDPLIRKEIILQYEKKGLAWLKEQVRGEDPLYFSSGETQNPQRLMRALEVMQGTGQSILSFRNTGRVPREFTIEKHGVEVPRERLNDRINKRVDQMIQMGLLDEVKSLVPYRDLNALQTVGYTELFNYLDNQISLDQAIDQIKINTRQYAKRQMTWFKKDGEIEWGEGFKF